METRVTGIGRLDRGHHGVACRRYTQPTQAGFVATAATAGHCRVDLGAIGCWGGKTGGNRARTIRVNQPCRNTATVTGFARRIVGRRDVATVAGGRQHNNAADTVESCIANARAMTGAASSRDATMRKFSADKGGHPSRRHQTGRYAIGVAHVACGRSGYVRRSQATYSFRVNAFKRSGRDRCAVAYRTSRRCTAVVEQRVCEFRTVLHRCAGHAGASSYVAGLAPERTHGNMAARDSGNGVPVRAVACCVGRAMALRTVSASGLDVRVNLRHGWQGTEISVATIASGTRRKRNVIGSQSLTTEVHSAAMALQAIAIHGMVNIVDRSGASTPERPRMEAVIQRSRSLN